MRYFLLSIIVFLSSCFFSFEEPLPQYVGSYEPKDLAEFLVKRYGWKTFLGTGQGKVYDDQQDSKHSFDFEVRVDRHRWGIRGFALVLSKTISGTLFEITSHKDRHLFADYTADPPGWLELDKKGRDKFQAIGGTSLATLRKAMIYSWPPRAKLEVLEDKITWGNWVFDRETLAIERYQDGDFVWIFSKWQPAEEGFWQAMKWRFQVKESYLEFYFDEIEEEVKYTKWDFELDTGKIGPLKQVAR